MIALKIASTSPAVSFHKIQPLGPSSPPRSSSFLLSPCSLLVPRTLPLVLLDLLYTHHSAFVFAQGRIPEGRATGKAGDDSVWEDERRGRGKAKTLWEEFRANLNIGQYFTA